MAEHDPIRVDDERHFRATTGITQETAGLIWNAHREILTAEKLLEDIEKAQKTAGDRRATHHPDVAKPVIRAHVLEKRAALEALNALASRELRGIFDTRVVAEGEPDA